MTLGQPQDKHKIGLNLKSLLLLILGRRKRCRVVGDSMLPTLCPGDTVFYRPTKNPSSIPLEGLIIVAKDPIRPKNLIIKRVHRSSHLGLEVRGDNELNSTDSRHFGVINYSHIIGLVDTIIRKDSKKAHIS